MSKSSISIIPQNAGGKSIHFDVVTSMGLRSSKKITKAPVTKGSPITDNIVNMGTPITLECQVTDTPLVSYEGNMISSDNAESRIHSAYSVIKALDENNTVCTIVNKFDTYYNMVLEEKEPIILPSNSVGFRLKFVPMRYVGEQRITLVTNLATKKAKDAEATKQGGGGKKEVDSKYILLDTIGDAGSNFSALVPTTGGTTP